MLVIHDEADDASSGVTAEAVIALAGGIHGEGGGFFLVEGAESFPGRAGAFEREIGSDDFDDVIGFRDAADAFFGKTGHGN